MGVRFWKGFHVTCGQCQHRNRPHKSPREGIKLALLDKLPNCRGCGKEMHLKTMPDRPLVGVVRAELIAAGLLPYPEQMTAPAEEATAATS